MRVYAANGTLVGQRARLNAAIPTLTAVGRSLSVGDFLALDVEADSHAEAVTIARQAVAAVLQHDEIERIVDADHVSQDRQIMLWVIATRRQVRRWEIVLARCVKADPTGNKSSNGSDIWQAQIEWHLALVAANNLVRAVDNARGRIAAMPEDLATDIRNHRDLQEHWDEQWPAFYDRTNPGPLKRSGKNFASRHPGDDPYWWLGWSSVSGPTLGPGLDVEPLYRELDRLQHEVLASSPDLGEYLAPIDESPWFDEKPGRWWPK